MFKYDEPLNCPFCDSECFADFVDVGVGMIQCGPYHCENCGASEQGPNDPERELSKIEIDTGWYAPNTEPSPSANVVNGKIVSHELISKLYHEKFEKYDFAGIENPLAELWNDKEYVKNWFKELRK